MIDILAQGIDFEDCDLQPIDYSMAAVDEAIDQLLEAKEGKDFLRSNIGKFLNSLKDPNKGYDYRLLSAIMLKKAFQASIFPTLTLKGDIEETFISIITDAEENIYFRLKLFDLTNELIFYGINLDTSKLLSVMLRGNIEDMALRERIPELICKYHVAKLLKSIEITVDYIDYNNNIDVVMSIIDLINRLGNFGDDIVKEYVYFKISSKDLVSLRNLISHIYLENIDDECVRDLINILKDENSPMKLRVDAMLILNSLSNEITDEDRYYLLNLLKNKNTGLEKRVEIASSLYNLIPYDTSISTDIYHTFREIIMDENEDTDFRIKILNYIYNVLELKKDEDIIEDLYFKIAKNKNVNPKIRESILNNLDLLNQQMGWNLYYL